MADVPEVAQYQSVRPLAVERDAARGYGGGAEQGETRRRREPTGRTPRQIADVASVMGIPVRELTPRVHEALELILNELDRVRWELDIAHEQEARLHRLAEGHPFLPVLNRRALLVQMVRLAEHAARTETTSFLVLVSVLNADAIRAEYGMAVRDTALRHAAETMRNGLREIDLLGALGDADFAAVLNVTGADHAAETGAALARAIAETPARIEGVNVRLETAWGCHPLDAARSPEETVAEAEVALRNNVGEQA